MKRSTLVEYEDAAPEVREIYDEIRETTGSHEVLNFLKALGHNARVLRAVWSMLRFTVLEGDVPAVLKQLILFRISVNAGNRYCTALHGHAALNLDPTLSYDDLMALSEGHAIATLPTSFQVALDVVSRAALDPKSVEAPGFEFEAQLRNEDFTESEIDELLAQGYFGVMLNMMTDAFDIPWEQPFPEGTTDVG